MALALAVLCAACATTAPRPTPASMPPPPASALKVLDGAFMAAYQAAARDHLRDLRASDPIILNDFLGMTLYRANGDVERFDMKKGPYFAMARASHPVLAVFSMVQPGGFGKLTNTERAALRDYIGQLEAAEADLATVDVDAAARARMQDVLGRTREFASASLRTGVLTESAFRAFAADVRPLVQENLRQGAREQLDQFRAQLETWRKRFPKERWSRLRVVVLGFHQARDLYATKLLFQWLLHEPSTEQRVVYAEVLIPPFGADRERSHALALELLAKVDLDREAAALILGDPTALQRDVMGPAARDLLQSWGPSDWP